MSRPEMPYLAAGAVSVIGGAVKEKAFPANGVLSITATIFLVIVVSMTSNTKVAPLMHAIGMLLLMGAIFGVIAKPSSANPVTQTRPTIGSTRNSGFNVTGPNTGGAGGGGGGSW